MKMIIVFGFHVYMYVFFSFCFIITITFLAVINSIRMGSLKVFLHIGFFGSGVGTRFFTTYIYQSITCFFYYHFLVNNRTLTQ
mmetsp:Transcript_15357/g.1375  ORF Transcript_15357/g.1375 Transcript_15357/m.1375 type:complete len:83 (+) Transcript_15357:174-422(+)